MGWSSWEVGRVSVSESEFRLSVHMDGSSGQQGSTVSNWSEEVEAEAEESFVEALIDYVEELMATISPGSNSIAAVVRARVRDSVLPCSELGREVVPLGLIFGAAASLELTEVRTFLSRFPNVLNESVRTSLDLVAETLLMVSDKELQISGTMATSVLVQRALPVGVNGRDRILHRAVELLELQYQDRMERHGEVFSFLRQVEKAVTLGDLPRLLSDLSEVLEDLACEKDVFLDDPAELVARPRENTESTEEVLRRVRLQSGANLPPLADEIEQLSQIAALLGWGSEQALQLAVNLYERKALDSRSKIGLSMAAIATLVSDLNENVDTKIRDLQVDEEVGAAAPYSLNPDSGTLTLHICYRGTLTGRILTAEKERVLEEVKQDEAEIEAELLEKAIKGYKEARAATHPNIISEEDEVGAIEGLAVDFGISHRSAYDMISTLYRTVRLSFSRDKAEGLSVQGFRDIVSKVAEPGAITFIDVDAEAPGLVPFHLEPSAHALKLHTAFRGLSDVTLEWYIEESSIEPLSLADPDEARLDDYEDPKKPGGLSMEHNVGKFVEEFSLAGDFAEESFEVLLESCPALQESVSIQALRVLVTTLNERLASGTTINLVTGWNRDIPGTRKPDQTSVAWLASHTEDEPLTMLTFNFDYGSGKTELPPFSDDVLLDWCRRYRGKIFETDA